MFVVGNYYKVNIQRGILWMLKGESQEVITSENAIFLRGFLFCPRTALYSHHFKEVKLKGITNKYLFNARVGKAEMEITHWKGEDTT